MIFELEELPVMEGQAPAALRFRWLKRQRGTQAVKISCSHYGDHDLQYLVALHRPIAILDVLTKDLAGHRCRQNAGGNICLQSLDRGLGCNDG